MLYISVWRTAVSLRVCVSSQFGSHVVTSVSSWLEPHCWQWPRLELLHFFLNVYIFTNSSFKSDSVWAATLTDLSIDYTHYYSAQTFLTIWNEEHKVKNTFHITMCVRVCAMIPTPHVPLLICYVSSMGQSDSGRNPPAPPPPRSPLFSPSLNLIPTAVTQKVYTSINIMLCAYMLCVMEEALPLA